MRIFITGASGYIGQAVAIGFRRRGHYVQGLVRTQDAAHKLYQNEIEPILGDIHQKQTFLPHLKQAEVIVHTAFESSPNGVEKDLEFIHTCLALPQDTSRAFLYTSGCWIYGNTKGTIADESTPVHPLKKVSFRPIHDATVLQAASNNLRTVVIRPGCVYGGEEKLTSLWLSTLDQGYLTIAGNGNNHWAMVHKDDLAEAYVLAAEKELSALVLNVVDHTHYTVREMAQALSDAAGLKGKLVSLSVEQSQKTYGPLAEGLLVDQRLSAELAMRLLDWKPRHLGFVEEAPLYFASWKANQK